MNAKKSVLISCFTLAVAGTSSSVMAENYFSVHGAYTMADDFNFQVAPGTISTDFDDGYGLGAALGTRFGQPGDATRWRVEGELTFRSNDVDTHRLNGGAPLVGPTGDIESTAVMLNALIDFDGASRFTPYLGAGVGLARVDASGFGVGAIPAVLDDNDTVIAYQVIAGGGYEVSPNTELFAEYRWFATEDPGVTTSAATGAVDTDIEYRTSNVLAGVRFRF